MTKTKNLGIWMDHASAHVMVVVDPMITNIVVSEFTHEEKEKTLQKGESMMHHKKQQQLGKYYKSLCEIIKRYDKVLIFGPTDAKTELLNILKADLHFSKIEIETRQTDRMSENEEQAYVKEYFSKN